MKFNTTTNVLFFATLVVSVFATLVSGCGDSKPKAIEALAVTSIAEQSSEIAARLAEQKTANEATSVAESIALDKRRMVSAIQEPVALWMAQYEKLSGKKAHEIEPFILQMRAIRSGMTSVATSACTEPKRNIIAGAMDQFLSQMAEFKSVKGEVSDEFNNRMGQTVAIVVDTSSALSQCAL